MKYCDLHCDALTCEGVSHTTGEALKVGGCLLQCFAAFVREGGYARFCALADDFSALCAREGYHPCTHTLHAGGCNAVLTSEGGAFSTLKELRGLAARGVRMAGFTWNTPTAAGYPCFPDYEGLLVGRCSKEARERTRGLTPFGRAALEEMFTLHILPDVSHGSDALFYEVAAFKRPFVASHSNAAAVQPCARNLLDEQIRLLADCGGVMGLNFCMDFLSRDGSADGQRAALLEHARHIVNVGGEEVLALGSDFDGIPTNSFLPSAASVPRLIDLIERAFGGRIAQKIARDNALRVLFSP